MYAASMDWELQSRLAAFSHLAELEQMYSLIPGRLLSEGFFWQGRRITLKGVKGI